VATVDGAAGGNITGPTSFLDDTGEMVIDLREGPTSGAGIARLYDAGGNLNILLGVSSGSSDHGAIAIYDELGNERATMWIPSTGAGIFSTKGPNESFNVRLSVLSNYANNGYVAVRDEFDNNQAGMYVASTGAGVAYYRGPGGNTIGAIGFLSGYPDNGIVIVDDAVNPGGFERAGMYAHPLEAGIVWTGGANRTSENTGLSFLAGYPDNGYIGAIDADRNWKAGMYVNTTGEGFIYTQGANGGCNTYAGSLNENPDNGYLGVSGATSCWSQAGMYVDTDETGILFTRGPNHNRNVRVANTEGFPDNGLVSVWDENDVEQAGMYVDSNGDGVIYADIKNFRMANPADENTEIWYASLEGPEAAAYIRGTGRLTNGRSEIRFEDHFSNVINSQGMTVQLTPLSAESKGLAVIEKNPDGMIVSELYNGKGNYDFDFVVMAVRRGHEDYRVIRPASKAKPAADELEPVNIMAPEALLGQLPAHGGIEEEAKLDENDAAGSIAIEPVDNNLKPKR